MEPKHPDITIVLATGNKDKVRELKPVLEGLASGISVRSLHDLSLDIEVEETEPTLEGNARLKADAIFELVSPRLDWFIALADDTGLEVDALGGAPGVYSARYAPVPEGATRTYADNVRHLLSEMRGKSERTARFRTVIAMKGRLPAPDGRAMLFDETTDGHIDGLITTGPQGDGGFGYDPVFAPEGMERTFAQIGIDEKNAISHRGRAVMAAATRIGELLSQCGIQ
ncbi:RdgB/HAM1 family non-canonical purine NTP pyrophosphatase [Chlorobaculum sp. 24CR]|uniref:RdgB/HAM1 family non-canonical purine NTP pyrophosphatase n=1 Tax=Chlorobaculum sp. 24CR TaxID=2508878 RepID=UPI00100BD33F|nr:RdgB/HAM1 family non-canonical purine NTP pyrophosphatase [Chlorobaculum sp. 24CR]RXK87600.1 RdgB/HAM1 family non-canonical purine NTP pyrophosphatase [Chlorobaculum sp. 24CR]